MDAIMNRRSVRKYRKEDIPDTEIELLLKAAMRAPSAGNEQPWEFLVIKNRDSLGRILEGEGHTAMLKEANCAIIVCGNIEKNRFPVDFWVQDCAAATQNLLIKAVDLGIGAVWMGTYPVPGRVKSCQDQFGLPANIIPFSVIALGYPAEEPQPIDTFDPQKIHREAW